MAGLKVSPHNEEAEQSVLGAILIDKDAIATVSSIIAPSDFYNPINGIVFGAMPKNPESIADKLTASFRPFGVFVEQELQRHYPTLIGEETGINEVEEQYIKQAFDIFKQNSIIAEPSGAAGLALYLYRYKDNHSPVDKKIVIINTGKGLWEDKQI